MPPESDDPIRQIQREVERIFRNLVYHRPLASHFCDPAWSPAADLVVSERSARVIVELAGVPRERIRVQLRGATLEISGRRNPPAPRSGNHYHRAEIWFGDFRRTVELPWVADENQVEARYRDGLLEIHLVAAAPAERTPVSIEHQQT